LHALPPQAPAKSCSFGNKLEAPGKKSYGTGSSGSTCPGQQPNLGLSEDPKRRGLISQHGPAGLPSQPTRQQKANRKATRSKGATGGKEVKEAAEPQSRGAAGPLSARRSDTDSNILSGAGGWERGCRALRQKTPPTNAPQGSRRHDNAFHAPHKCSPKSTSRHDGMGATLGQQVVIVFPI